VYAPRVANCNLLPVHSFLLLRHTHYTPHTKRNTLAILVSVQVPPSCLPVCHLQMALRMWWVQPQRPSQQQVLVGRAWRLEVVLRVSLTQHEPAKCVCAYKPPVEECTVRALLQHALSACLLVSLTSRSSMNCSWAVWLDLTYAGRCLCAASVKGSRVVTDHCVNRRRWVGQAWVLSCLTCMEWSHTCSQLKWLC